MDFKLVSDYAPMGDQPEAIGQLVSSIEHGSKHNTLLGVTGSGKTFTVANVIARLNRPTLVLSHNKTLAAQLYGEFRNFFPENAVEYFVSYYDYYQPEAYLPSTDTYIEKDLQINAEIEKMRLGTVATLLSGRRDVIVVSSVSCLYGAGNPVVAKGHLGLLLSRIETLLEFFWRIGHTHTFAASAKGSLYDDRISHLIRDPGAFLRVIDWLLASGNHRNPCGYHGIPGFLLISKPCDNLGIRTDKGDVALLAQLREFCILRQEPKSRMYGIRAGHDGRADDAVHAEITLA